MQLFSKDLNHDTVTPLLDQIAKDYARLTGRGGMRGILLVDQDAKVIAKNSMFQFKRPWDMGAIGAALYGVAGQSQRYFNCSSMERVSIIFGDMQLFIHNIGKVEMDENETQRDLLLVILADKSVKVGLVIVQMKRFAQAIIDAIKESQNTIDMLHLPERQIKEYLLGLKTGA
ncbi:MAG: roadblock/LC7 domain-containing protein [Candidatus Hodarchaeota archaeon]